MTEVPDYAVRAAVILEVIRKTGGQAGVQEIWLRMNQGGYQLPQGQVRRMLRRMIDRGHITVQSADPVTYAVTQSGLDWLNRARKRSART